MDGTHADEMLASDLYANCAFNKNCFNKNTQA